MPRVERHAAALPRWIDDELSTFTSSAIERLAVVAVAIGATRVLWRRSTVKEFLGRPGPPDEPIVPIEAGYLQPPWHVTREQAEIVDQEVDDQFPTLAGMALVASWAGLEVFVQRLVAAWIANRPEARQQAQVRRVEGSLIDYEAMGEEERRLFIARRLQERTPAGRGVEQFEAVLSVFGLGGSIRPELSRTLMELRSVRNVIVHRQGTADQRFQEECPWVTVSPGSRIVVDYGRLLAYIWATVEYAQKVMERVAAEFGVTLPPVELPAGLEMPPLSLRDVTM